MDYLGGANVIISEVFFEILFIHLRKGGKERARPGGGAEGREEVGSPLTMEPDLELDPRTLGS